METIKLVNKKTGRAADYYIYPGNIPQTIMVEIVGGEARGYTSLDALAADYLIKDKEGDK